MEQLTIQVDPRERVQKGDNRKLRREGRVPAVIYGGQVAPASVSLDDHEIELVLRGATRSNAIFTIGDQQAIIREVQRHPVNNRLLHIDFMRVDMSREIEVEVPIHVSGEIPLGVRAGGVLEHLQRTVTVICRPGDLPNHIDANLSGLEMNHSFHVSDLVLPSGVRVIDEPETALFTILPPRKEAEEAAAEGAPTEPEVVGREKKEKGE